jgi:hypothetical protein
MPVQRSKPTLANRSGIAGAGACHRAGWLRLPAAVDASGALRMRIAPRAAAKWHAFRFIGHSA